MNFSEKIEIILRHFAESPSGLEKILGLSNGYLSNVTKKGTGNPGKLLIALNEKGISADWFITGKGEMLIKDLPSKSSHQNLNTTGSYKVPLLRQRISCGTGVDWETEENIEQHIDIFSVVSRLNLGRPFAMKAHGTSMLGAGIEDGDYIIFNADVSQFLDDDIYVVALDGELFCKRLEFDRFLKKIKVYSVRVKDLNEAELLATINIDDSDYADRFKIFGRVLFWVHPHLIPFFRHKEAFASETV